MERAASPAGLLKALGKPGVRTEIIEDLPTAIERGLALMQPGDLFCITGSLYTVGEARAYLLPGDDA